MRHSLQQLSDQGAVSTPLTTWPLMWVEAQNLLDAAARPDVSPHLFGSRDYVQFEAGQQARLGARVTVELSAATEPLLFRGFAQRPREQGEIGSSTEWTGEWLAVRLSPSLTLDPQDQKSYRLDDSFAAVTMGNWVMGFGEIDRWWGPGWQSSLILSSNARPTPGVWLNRKQAQAPEAAGLSWIGPWTLNAFAGQLEGTRSVSEAKLLGFRFTFMPLDRLEIGISRTTQWGGENRPDGFSSLVDILGNADDTAETDEQLADLSGNRLTAIDFRWGFSSGRQSFGLYGQLMGDMSSMPSRDLYLMGLDMAANWWGDSQRLYLEATGTESADEDSIFHARSAYEHEAYTTGYRYRGRNLGSTWETDAKAVSLGAINFFSDGTDLGFSATYAQLNRKDRTVAVTPSSDRVQYSLPSQAQDLWIVDGYYRFVFLNGRTTLFGQWMSDPLQTVSGERSALSLGVSWQYRF